MKIIVCIKQVPAGMKADIDPETGTLKRMSADTRTNPYDLFALESALAGAAGVLLGLYYNQIEPLMGMTPGLKAFVAAVLGGIGIIPGAALGGFVIGIIETFTYVISLDTFRDAIVYAVLIIILLVRPSGILGKNVKEKV